MESRIVLTETQFDELAKRDVGPRIRFLRELLQSEYGDRYTSKNVALRIEVISPQALSVIERGETKDCPSKVLAAIANDFRVDINIFFDEFYKHGYRPITIPWEKRRSTQMQHRRKIGVLVYEQNHNNEIRFIFNQLSDRKVNINFIVFFTKVLYSIFQLLGLKTYTDTPEKLAKTNYHIHEKFDGTFPWIPKEIWNTHFHQMNEEALMYQETKCKE
ncbi:hypothetical protein EDM57_19720 [Brevibacillus gelatini]|uniref:Uncharacterized protein n=1 Tax=Brevibacillus gelatini TaxID=1655277 RepID=A0A3M8ASK1_9BACL|nr:hypothetical protein [Brevibacillus gelatini]RNB53525.1 hypothetical protein EDM57_19720 [Brevibacillus gelatini]